MPPEKIKLQQGVKSPVTKNAERDSTPVCYTKIYYDLIISKCNFLVN